MGFVLGGTFVWSIQPPPLPYDITYKEPTEQKAKAESKDVTPAKDVEEQLATYTLWLAIFTAVLAASTIGLWIVTYLGSRKQSRDMQASIAVAKQSAEAAELNAKAAAGANRIASDNLEFTHRARVSILSPAVDHRAVKGKILVDYILEKTGNFAATQISESFGDTMGPEWHPPTKDTLKIAPQIEEMGLIIQPRESIPRHRELNAPLPQYFEKARKETFYLRFGIVVVYLDGFNKARTTWRWFEWDPKSDTYRECAARQD